MSQRRRPPRTRKAKTGKHKAGTRGGRNSREKPVRTVGRNSGPWAQARNERRQQQNEQEKTGK